MSAIALSALVPDMPVSVNEARGGLNLVAGRPGSEAQATVSDVWHLAGWRLQVVLMGARDTVAPDAAAAVYAKVITGSLSTPERGVLAAPFQVRNTRLHGETMVAGDDGALVAVLTETDAAVGRISSVSQLEFAGPCAEHLIWRSFEDRFSGFTDYFNGADAHMASGLHVLDDEGAEIVYLNFWVAGKGVDLSTHNHGQTPSLSAPAFAEVHWVFANGTGSGGMYSCDAPDSTERTRLPMQKGDEHGAFFEFDSAGRPARRDNGAVRYPWHGWQAGADDGRGEQAYDVVLAFEINPDYVHR